MKTSSTPLTQKPLQGAAAFPRMTTYHGRNGTGKMQGLSVLPGTQNNLYLEPINSRGNIGRCWLELPIEATTQVVDQLLATAYPHPGNEYSQRLEDARRQKLEDALSQMLRQAAPLEAEQAQSLAASLLTKILQQVRPDCLVAGPRKPASA